MAGIYQRDNYAQLMQNALNSAYNRRAATQRERAERVKEIVNAGGDFAKVAGRTAEEWNVPDQYADNPDYRAARFDYILSGDRSGLDAFRQAEAQAEQQRKQQEFTAAENALNRAMQERENDKNRALQKKQQDDNRTTEKARLLANIRTAQAIVKDAEDNPTKYTALDRAKANSDLTLQHDLAEKSGWFTDEEMRKIKGLPEEPKAPATVVPFKPGYTPEAAPVATEVPAATGTPAAESGSPIIDWENLKNAARTAKTLDDIKAQRERLAGIKQTEANVKEHNETGNAIDAKEKEIKNKMAAAAKKKARIDTAKTRKFSKSDVREALGIGKEGGGNSSAKMKFDYVHDGKTITAEADVQRDGKNAKIIVDGETVQTIPLF